MTVIIPFVPVIDDSPEEAIHLLLTGIGDEIYSTIDACKTAHDMWTAIERLQQGDLLTFNMLFDVLKQYQKEVNENRSERIAKNANPLALVVAAQQYPDPYYQAPKSHKSYAPPSKHSSSTRSNASTKYKGKEIAKPIIPPSKSASKEENDIEQAQRDKDMQKNLRLVAKYKNDNQTGQFGNQRTVTVAGTRETIDYTYHKENMLMCKQAEKGVPLQADQADWLEDTNKEIDEQELEAHYNYMAKIQETDKNAVECDAERVTLSNLIENLKLDDDENKKIQKQLKKIYSCRD
nr:hypothetical protein [Tanacetum cinerariifolium]